MEKKEVMAMNLSPKVEEMERARRATGISSTAALHGSGVKTVVPTGGRIRVRIRMRNMSARCHRWPLSLYEQQKVLDTLYDERFVDKTPQEVYAALLDGGSYLCSVRTMYQILEAHKEVKERRNQLRHPVYTKPLCHPRYL